LLLDKYIFIFKDGKNQLRGWAIAR